MLPVVLPGPGIRPPRWRRARRRRPHDALRRTDDVPDRGAHAAPTPTATPVATPAPTPVVYVVKAGDQLDRDRGEYGVTVAAIQEANGITDPNRIFVGQKLKIPPKPTPAATAAP